MILLAAFSDNRVIGKDGKIPWHIPEDLKRFKSLTLNHPIVMGRKTYESIGKSLYGRTNIVISEHNHFCPLGEPIVLCRSIGDAIKEAERRNSDYYIIGGQSIYEQTIRRADILETTQVHAFYEGDAFFPEIDMNIWEEKERQDKFWDNIGFSFVCYERKVLNSSVSYLIDEP